MGSRSVLTMSGQLDSRSYTVYNNYLTALLLRRAPVSLPGGPRPGASRIRREPVWCSKDWEFEGPEWTFVGADRSHDKSRRQNCKFKLSGEASGRQTWWFDSTSDSKKIFTFNPAKNPNTSDRVFREQQIKSWHLRNEERTTTLNDTPKRARRYTTFENSCDTTCDQSY